MLRGAALTEFAGGDAERGRGIFESVLRNYPKRLDLWSVYIDQVRSTQQIGSVPHLPTYSILSSLSIGVLLDLSLDFMVQYAVHLAPSHSIASASA